MLRQQEEHIGMLVASIRRRIRQVVHAQARNHRLSPQQFWILLAIHDAGPLSLGALGDRVPVDPPTASRVVASLTRRRLVWMTEDPEDRRRLLIATTTEGADLAARLRPLARNLREAVTAGFSPAEVALLRASLRRILANIDRFEGRLARRQARPPAAKENQA